MNITGRIAGFVCCMLPAPMLSAQQISIVHDTMTADTRGYHVTDAVQWSDSAILFDNHVINNSDTAIVFSWQIIENDLPFGWFIHGFCDNVSCRTQNDPAITDNALQQSMPVAAGSSSLLEPQIAVPSDGDDGTGILRVRVACGTYVDTATFIIAKNSATGLKEINGTGRQLRLFPNPARQSLMVDAGGQPGSLHCYNVAGREVLSVAVPSGKSIFPLAVGQLADGLYFIRLTDAGNRTWATGRFVKQ